MSRVALAVCFYLALSSIAFADSKEHPKDLLSEIKRLERSIDNHEIKSAEIIKKLLERIAILEKRVFDLEEHSKPLNKENSQ